MTRPAAATACGWAASFFYLLGFLYAVGVEPLWALVIGSGSTAWTAWCTRDVPNLSAGRLGQIAALGTVGLALCLLMDAYASGVNLLDHTQWPNLLKSGPLGFVGTAGLACGLINFTLAHAVRIVVLRTFR